MNVYSSSFAVNTFILAINAATAGDSQFLDTGRDGYYYNIISVIKCWNGSVLSLSIVRYVPVQLHHFVYFKERCHLCLVLHYNNYINKVRVSIL